MLLTPGHLLASVKFDYGFPSSPPPQLSCHPHFLCGLGISFLTGYQFDNFYLDSVLRWRELSNSQMLSCHFNVKPGKSFPLSYVCRVQPSWRALPSPAPPPPIRPLHTSVVSSVTRFLRSFFLLAILNVSDAPSVSCIHPCLSLPLEYSLLLQLPNNHLTWLIHYSTFGFQLKHHNFSSRLLVNLGFLILCSLTTPLLSKQSVCSLQ